MILTREGIYLGFRAYAKLLETKQVVVSPKVYRVLQEMDTSSLLFRSTGSLESNFMPHDLDFYTKEKVFAEIEYRDWGFVKIKLSPYAKAVLPSIVWELRSPAYTEGIMLGRLSYRMERVLGKVHIQAYSQDDFRKKKIIMKMYYQFAAHLQNNKESHKNFQNMLAAHLQNA